MPVLTSTHERIIEEWEKVVDRLERDLASMTQERDYCRSFGDRAIEGIRNFRLQRDAAIQERDHFKADVERLKHERDEAIGNHEAIALQLQVLLDENEHLLGVIDDLQAELATVVDSTVAVTAAVFAVSGSGVATFLGGVA